MRSVRYLALSAGAILLAVLVFSGGHNAQATTGVADPVVGSINRVAIDLDTTGNAPGTGDGTFVSAIDMVCCTPTQTNVSANHPIDIIVDEVATADGFVKGYGFNLHFDRTVIKLVAPQEPATHMCDTCSQFTGGSFATANSATGDWRVDVYDVSGVTSGDHTGEGVLMRVSIKCVSTSPGFSKLTLVDDTHGPAFAPQVYESTRTSGDPDTTAPILDFTGKTGGALTATVYCNMAPPTPSDLAIGANTDDPTTSVPVNAPPTTTANVPFSVTVGNGSGVCSATELCVENEGPNGPITGDVTEVLNMPADCAAVGGPSKTVTGLSLPVSTDVVVPTQTFSVTCLTASLHNISATATVSVDPADTGHYDPNPANDSSTSAVSTIAITATADPAITGASATSSAPSQCLPQMPPAPSCVSAPSVAIGTPQTVTVHKTIDNLSGYSPVGVSDAVTWIGASEAPGGSNNQNPCTPSGANQCTWANGTTCTVTPTGTNPQTATVGPAVTLNFTFTATCTVDSFFDINNPQQIVLLFRDDLTPASSVTDSDPTNNVVASTALSFWSSPFADLSTAASGTGSIYAGNPVTDTITVTNNGPALATNVTLTNTLSGPYTFNSVSASQGSCVASSTPIVCSLGSISAGGSATVTFNVTATAAGTIANSASVTGNEFDPNTANNSATASTVVLPATSDVSVTVNGTGSVYGGSPVTHTVTVTNNGPSPATNVMLTDTLSGPYSYNSTTPSQGSCSHPSQIVCSLGSLSVGSSATVTIGAMGTAGGTVTNSSSVTAADIDPNNSNNNASASTTVIPLANLSIVLSALPPTVNFGGTLTYNMAVTNGGPSLATGVTVTDFLPLGVVLFSGTVSQGSCVQAAGIVCTLGSIASGGVATVAITVTPTLVGTVTNTASVSGNELDPLLSNNTSTVQSVTVDSTGYDLTGIWSGEFDNAALGLCTTALSQTGSGMASLSGSMFCTAASGGSLTGNFNVASRRINLVATFAQPSYTVTISNGLLSQDLTTLFGTWTCSCQSGAQAFFMSRSQPSTSSVVSASAGGSLQTATGDTLTVPAGALSSNTTLTSEIQTAPGPAPSGLTAISRAYDFGPSGTTFSHPVTAVFHYTDADLAGGLVDPTTLRVWVYDGLNQQWLPLGGTVDTAAKTITVSLNHFSEYALFGSIPSQSDSDADGVLNSVDNCPNWTNPLQAALPWATPAGDSDCDGFTATTEAFFGTDPGKHCAATSTPNDEPLPDAWPVDFNNDQSASLTDIFKIVPHLNTLDTDPGSSQRFDLSGDGSINLTDIFKVVPFLNQSCAP